MTSQKIDWLKLMRLKILEIDSQKSNYDVMSSELSILRLGDW
jgi:hypothetical protein